MKHPEKIYLPCAICGLETNTDYDLLYALGDYEVIRCGACDLVYVNAIFEVKAKEEGEVYASEVYAQLAEPLMKRFREDIKELSCLSPPGKILDVGCGYGYFLDVAKQAGWNVTGVEINKKLVEHLCHERGIDAFAGTLEEQNFLSGAFDAVTMFNILEHLLYPAVTLREVNRILKRNGILILESPTEDGLFKKIGAFLYALSGGKLAFMIKGAYQNGGHHHGFSRKTMTNILNVNGFRVHHIRGRMSPFKEFLQKEILDAAPHMKLIKVIAVPILWGLSWLLRMENRMLVCAVKEYDMVQNQSSLL